MKRTLQCCWLFFILSWLYTWNVYIYLDNELSSLNASIEQLDADMNHVEAELNELEGAVDALQDRINNIPDRIVISEQDLSYTPDTPEQIEEEIRLGEMEMLAQLIEAEAGNQDFKGKQLVADVVLNRVDAGWADGTIEGVIFQVLGNGVAQFSTTQDGAYERAGWHISDSSFKAAEIEYEAHNRLDENIYYFTAGRYNASGTPGYIYGDHYFSYN